ncbi:MAG: MBOAT family protein [Bacteroidota bacterium]|nr:MBOAT family protein [Bacteroidota bacterium]
MKEWLLDILTYHDNEPLLFTQLYFWGFFAIVLIVYSFIYKDRAARNIFLFFASLFFYYKTSGFFFVILLVSTLTDYIIGHLIYRTEGRILKKVWLGLSIAINLFILGYFKYAYFFAENLNHLFGYDMEVINQFALLTNNAFGTDFTWDRILLPVGISFFTFQTISYSVDVYRGHIKPVNNILDFGFYVSFFPQLVAGPIVRAADFIPQLYKDYKLTREEWGIALFWILNGLLKKMFLADYIAINFVDRVFTNPGSYTGFENLMALIGYSLQVYADFSGYTDIAIGIALMLGFRLPVNFNSPYKATSVASFWKRWHISLSSWLRDYLYIPMGGNRGGSFFSYTMMLVVLFFVSLLANTWVVPVVAASLLVIFMILMRISPSIKLWIDTNINLMLTMLLGGLWHGASWNFVVWGGLNGLGLVVYKAWKNISPWKNKEKWYNRAWSITITFAFITFTRAWFRSPTFDGALEMIYRVGNQFDVTVIPEVLWSFRSVFLVMLLGFIIHWLPVTTKDWYRGWFVRSPYPVKIAASFVTVFFIYQILSADLQPFIYFAF